MNDNNIIFIPPAPGSEPKPDNNERPDDNVNQPQSQTNAPAPEAPSGAAGENGNNSNGHKSSDHLYLEQLEFRPELRKSWLNFFVVNFRVVILMIMLISAWGIYSFMKLPRESNPEVKIPIAVVITTYPGVGPTDMEELVTKKVEAGISGISGIDRISSNSSNSLSSVTVEFGAKEDLDDSLRKLRDQVNSLKNDLPEDANDPIVQEISFDDQPILTLALTGPYDGLTLRKYADDIKDELEKIPGAREVNVSGGDEREFEVAYDPQKLTFYSISPDQANQIIAATNLAFPSGTFKGKEYNYPVRTDARFFDAKKLANIPIFHTDQGAIVYLRDIADIKEKSIERSVLSRFSIEGHEPQEAVTISVVKKTGGSILNVVDESTKVLDTEVSKLEGVKYDKIVDMAKYIRMDFDQLTHDFILTLILVFAILFLIVGLKEALVAGLAIPLVFFTSFGVMLSTGLTLNFLSIFSLILSLGLLVDDAIVVVSATKQYLRTGKFTPEEAVLLVLNDFKVVLTTTTLTTVWAFLPLISASGIIGEFIKSIPITVSVTLIASLLIALMINHPLAAVLERIRLTRNLLFAYMAGLFGIAVILALQGKILYYILAIIPFAIAIYMGRWYRAKGKEKLLLNEARVAEEWKDDELIKGKLRRAGEDHAGKNLWKRLQHGIINFNAVLPVYEKYLKKALVTKKRRWQVMGATFGLFVIACLLPATGIVPMEFFPASDQEFIYINFRAPTGLVLAKTNDIISNVENKLLSVPEIDNFSTIVGQQGAGGDFAIGLSSSSHLGSITITLSDPDERKRTSYDIAEVLRKEFEPINEAEVTVSTPSGGPPAGSAFEARVVGDDLQTLDKIANDLKPVLASISGVVNADVSLKDSPAEYTFSLDPARLELYNLNAAYVGSVLRMAISGNEVTKIIRDGKEIKIMARFNKDRLPTLESVQNIQILNLRKQPVFLKDVAKIELKPSVDSISRIDQKRVVLLSADAAGKARPAAILTEFQSKVKDDYKLPAGYSITYGGENEENAESVMSIMRAMVVAGLLIISTLIIQFNSFKKATIVLIAIPLALIGVFFGLAIMRINLSFPGLIGILALFGIVVKNSIILIDKINLNLKSNIPFVDSVIDAGKSRLEAIFITSICTIIGIIPITLSNEMWMGLGTAIIFGLMLSSFMTLFMVPVLFVTFVKDPNN